MNLQVSYVLLFLVTSCFGGNEPKPIETTNAYHQRFQKSLEAQLKNLKVEGEVVTLSFMGLYSKDDKGSFLLKVGESFQDLDHHYQTAFTLTKIEPMNLTFEYIHHYQHRFAGPQPGQGTDRGTVVLSTSVYAPTFQIEWLGCNTAAQCTIVRTNCDEQVVVGASHKAVVENYYSKKRTVSRCRVEQAAPPIPTCIDQKCGPHPGK
jgi:hypothetical protein